MVWLSVDSPQLSQALGKERLLQRLSVSPKKGVLSAQMSVMGNSCLIYQLCLIIEIKVFMCLTSGSMCVLAKGRDLHNIDGQALVFLNVGHYQNLKPGSLALFS